MAILRFTKNGSYDPNNVAPLEGSSINVINVGSGPFSLNAYGLYGLFYDIGNEFNGSIPMSPSGNYFLGSSDGVFADFSDKSGMVNLNSGGVGDILLGGSAADFLNGNGGDDRLTGNAGADVLIGGEGVDTLDGGDGNDTASYETSGGALTASLADPSLNTGDALGDTYVSIENLRGSAGDDTLTGDAGDNVLEGGAGGDTLDGGDGFDTVSYANASAGVGVSDLFLIAASGDAIGDGYTSIERFVGSRYDDTFNLFSAVIVEGGAGADRFNSIVGSGLTVSYEHSSAGVYVDLTGDTVNFGGEADNDSFFSVSNVIGSTYADTLFGSNDDGVLTGNGGLDTIRAGSGNDTISVTGAWASINAGNGTDRLEIHADGAGTIVADAGSVSGTERTVVLDGAHVDLGALTESVGTIKILGAAAEVVGTQVADQIFGGAGADTIVGGGGADLLRGGAGADTFVYLSEADFGSVGIERIFNFSGDTGQGDRIDLSALGITGVHGGRFTAEGDAQMRVFDGTNGFSTLTFDFDGDGTRDASLRVKSAATLTADDFVFANPPEPMTFDPSATADRLDHVMVVGGHSGALSDGLLIHLV